MKKLIALLLALVMVMSLAACGGTKPTEPPVENPTDAPVENPTDAPVEDPTDAPAAGNGTIAVIAKGETHAFWQAVKAGAEAAGAEAATLLLSAAPPLKAKSMLVPSVKWFRLL